MAEITIPESPNLALVAFYEKTRSLKPDAFASLIEGVQQSIREVLERNGVDPSTFEAYEREQVHATVLGCEGASTRQGILSKWFLEKRGQRRYLDCENLLRHFRCDSNLPIRVRFCGFRQHSEFPFRSRGEHPYFRSFQIRTDNDSAVLVGWPSEGGRYPPALDRLRVAGQKYNALHKFHESPEAVDNDCYVVLGRFTSLPSRRIREKIEKRTRDMLAGTNEICAAIDRSTLSLVRYRDTALSLENTDVWQLDGISAHEMRRLYPGVEYRD